jgi:SAM-dependent methyltransferase
MSERQPDIKRNHNVDLSTLHQYSGSSLNVLARAYIMEEYAVPRINMKAEIIRALILGGYRGDESVIDAGCGDGDWAISLVEEYGHTGPVVGINDSANPFILGQERVREKKISNVRFMEMDARYLEFPDNTFDIFSGQNLLYHIDDYEKALRELQRTSKPGARGIIATKGDFHQIRIWEGHKRIESKLKPPMEGMPRPKAPEIFYHHFDLEEAGDILEPYFEVIPELSFKQDTIARIPAEGWEYYRQAALGTKDSYVPIPRGGELKRLIDTEFKGIFDREVREKGFFTDRVQRGFYFVVNSKK